MYRYSFGMKRRLNKFEVLSRKRFHDIRTRFFRPLGIVAILLMPAAAVGWWYLGSSLSADSAFSQSETIKQNSKETPRITPVQPNATTNVTTVQQDSQTVKIDKTPAKTKLQVNGREIALPENGSVHKEINDKDGTTSVDISIESVSSESSDSYSTMNIELNSSTESSSDSS